MAGVRKHLEWSICLLVAVVLMSGCATTQGTLQDPVAEPSTKPPEEMIELECRVAYRQGCRHKGRIYPWHAWVETMGYRSTDYEVKDIQRVDTRATVYVMKR